MDGKNFIKALVNFRETELNNLMEKKRDLVGSEILYFWGVSKEQESYFFLSSFLLSDLSELD